MEERFEAGQASYEEVKNEIQERLLQPKMEPKVRELPDQAARGRVPRDQGGYVDSGAAPGKDTRWKDVGQLKPQTTTKEEVAARRTQEEAPLGDPAARVKEAGSTSAGDVRSAPADRYRRRTPGAPPRGRRPRKQ